MVEMLHHLEMGHNMEALVVAELEELGVILHHQLLVMVV